MSELSAWFNENELILNLKKGKTEAPLFGTAQRIRKCTEPLRILHENGQINVTSTYKYLGVQLDSSLNLNGDFDAKYKKASGRLRLLAKIRNHLDIESSKAIYRSMVLPVLTYCGLLNLKLTRTQENKLNSLHNRAMQIITKKRTCKVISPVNAIKRRACVLVHNVLQNNVCHALSQYFTYQEHCKNTRNNRYSVCLPQIRTEYARKGFFYMGAKTFNELPLTARMVTMYLLLGRLWTTYMDKI